MLEYETVAIDHKDISNGLFRVCHSKAIDVVEMIKVIDSNNTVKASCNKVRFFPRVLNHACNRLFQLLKLMN